MSNLKIRVECPPCDAHAANRIHFQPTHRNIGITFYLTVMKYRNLEVVLCNSVFYFYCVTRWFVHKCFYVKSVCLP